MNMNTKNKNAVMRKIMEYDFALKEIELYLDTHQNDQNALALYHKYREKSREYTDYYNNNFGPITSKENVSTSCWDWVNSPWPWEN